VRAVSDGVQWDHQSLAISATPSSVVDIIAHHVPRYMN
jgi:hypothetical protein